MAVSHLSSTQLTQATQPQHDLQLFGVLGPEPNDMKWIGTQSTRMHI